jgi:ABC-type lipoprotein export system ATPase subunit/bifunctional DNA-binding transcriptional regulator/antitoxin component of YhaV-PrlF toxin-antitoxin module
MGSEPVIICDGLVKIHRVADLETVALQGLDLVVAPGELLGIVGPSGSGKSTLLNILGGLDRPSAGRVFVDGQDLLKLSDLALNRYRQQKVGFVWQQGSRNLVPYLSAQENVELPMTLAGKEVNFKRKHARELLEAVELGERRHFRLEELSGGEQQRVAFAVSLANSPKLLLADEPTGELDTTTALSIYELIRRINREFGVTILIVSHDLGLARHVNRLVSIRDGKTATETVRVINHDKKSEPHAEGEAHTADTQQHVTFDELMILDSAGRFQIPKDYLERYAIKRRIRLELLDEGILIQPASQPEEARDTEDLASDMAATLEGGKWHRLRRLLARPGILQMVAKVESGIFKRTQDRQEREADGGDSE